MWEFKKFQYFASYFALYFQWICLSVIFPIRTALTRPPTVDDDFGKWKNSKQSLLKIIFRWLFELFNNSNKNISMNYLYIELCSNRTSLLLNYSVVFSSEYSEFRRSWIWTILNVNDPELNDPEILRSWNRMVYKLDGFRSVDPWSIPWIWFLFMLVLLFLFVNLCELLLV